MLYRVELHLHTFMLYCELASYIVLIPDGRNFTLSERLTELIVLRHSASPKFTFLSRLAEPQLLPRLADLYA